METVVSAFQQQNPLSPRKFWKKMFGSTIRSFFLSLVATVAAGGIVTIVVVFKNQNINLWVLLVAYVGIFIAVWGTILLLYAWYFKTYIARYYYDVGSQFVTIKKGVFTPAEIHIQYQKIQDVYVNQDFFDRLIGLYDVHLASATSASGIEAHIDGVEAGAAENIKNFLLERIQNPQSPGAMPQTAGDVAAATQNGNPDRHFVKDYSSATFPIQARWLFVKSGQIFVTTLGLLAVSAFMLVGQLEEVRGSIISSLIVPGFIGVYFLFVVGQCIWIISWRKRYFFSFTPQFLLLKEGIWSRQEKHIPYRVIQDVALRQGFFESLLGLGNVVIENASSGGGRGKYSQNGITIPGLNLDQAKEIVDLLRGILEKTNSRSSGL